MGNYLANLRETSIRLYDANNVYHVCPFVDGTISFPAAANRPDEELIIDRGKADTNMHFIVADDTTIFQPLKGSITFQLDMGTVVKETIDFLGNPFGLSPWKPGGGTATVAPVTTLGSRTNIDGTSVTCKAPRDAVKVAALLNIEMLTVNPDASGDDFGRKLQGVYFQPPMESVVNPKGSLVTNYEVYGAVTVMAAFTSGSAYA